MAVAYDSTGVGVAGLASAGGSPTYTHTVVTAGATVFLDVGVDRACTLSNVTCGGSAMTLVDTVTLTSGQSGAAFVARYRLDNVGSGSKTISVTFSAASWVCFNSVAFTGVGSLGSLQSATGTGTSTSISATGTADILECTFGWKGTSGTFTPSGGTNRWNGAAVSGSNRLALMAISTTTSGATTFSNTVTNSTVWGAMAHELLASTLSGGASTTTTAGLTAAGVVGLVGDVSFAVTAGLTSTGTSDTPSYTGDASTTVAVHLTAAQLLGVNGVMNTTVAAGLTAAGVVGKVGSASTTVAVGLTATDWPLANPLQRVREKLNASQSVILQTIGDSTVYGAGDGAFPGNGTAKGWTGRLAVLIGTYFDVDVLYVEYNGTTHVYSSPATLFTGSGANSHTVTIRNGGINSQYISNLTVYINTYNLLNESAADSVLIGTGINDVVVSNLTPSTYVPAYLTFLDLIRTKCPVATLVATTQDILSSTAMAGSYADYDDNYNALMTELVGSNMPISPPVQASTGHRGTYAVDTQQAYGSYSATYMRDDVHPNSTGYALQAAWMFAQLISASGAASATISVGLTAAGTVTSGLSGQSSVTVTAQLTSAGLIGAIGVGTAVFAVGLTASGAVGVIAASTLACTATLTALGAVSSSEDVEPAAATMVLADLATATMTLGDLP